MSSTSGPESVGVSVQPVLVELDDKLKAKLVNDLSSICEISKSEARAMLERDRWNIQVAIDTFLDAPGGDDDPVVLFSQLKPTAHRVADEINLVDDKDKGTSTPLPSLSANKSAGGKSSFSSSVDTPANMAGFSKLAPENFSVMSWNLDGLDDKNLEKRTESVVRLVQEEKHDILLFQELTPVTFDFIARKLESYLPIIGTTESTSQYFTATFLRLNRIYHVDDYIVPFPNSSMDRNLLVTKAFIGQAKLFILNSHLESTNEFSKERIAQLKICFDHSLSFPPEYNVIFGGDLNLRDREVEGMIPANMHDLWMKCGSRQTCRYTWDLTRNTNKQMPSKWQPRCRFDRLYFRSSMEEVLTPEFFGVTGIERVEGCQSFPSDHWAIIAFFHMTDQARQPNTSKKDVQA